MDNFSIDIVARGRDNLKAALTIAFSEHSKAIATRIHPEFGLILYWTDPTNPKPETNKLLFPHDVAAASDLVWNWLLNVPNDSYRDKIDFDGSLVKAWRVYNQDWGRVDGEWEAFVAIEPVWGWLGK